MMRRLLVASGLLCAVASCAPHRGPLPALDRDAREQQFRSMIEAHTGQTGAIEADLVMRAERTAGRRLPWVSGRMLIERPDRVRVRMGSLFATALDVAVRGDTLEAVVPKERLGLSLASSRDSLGVPAAGGLAVRVLTGVWQPPDSAWSAAHSVADRLELSWLEEADTVELVIGRNGLPDEARWRKADGATLSARYQRWSRLAGMPWPVRVKLQAEPSGWTIACRMERVRFREAPARDRWSLQVPESYTRLTSADLHEMIEGIGRER